jgi:outer membrane biosynthesis protein TonB
VRIQRPTQRRASTSNPVALIALLLLAFGLAGGLFGLIGALAPVNSAPAAFPTSSPFAAAGTLTAEVPPSLLGPTGGPTLPPEPSATGAETLEPTAGPTPRPTARPPRRTARPTSRSTPRPTPRPTAKATVKPTPKATQRPSQTPAHSPKPSQTPRPSATVRTSPKPSHTPRPTRSPGPSARRAGAVPGHDSQPAGTPPADGGAVLIALLALSGFAVRLFRPKPETSSDD